MTLSRAAVLFVFAFYLALGFVSQASAQSIEWRKKYAATVGGHGIDIATDGNIFGYGISGSYPFYNAVVVKTDAVGSETWRATYDLGYDGFTLDLKATPDKGFVSVGLFGPEEVGQPRMWRFAANGDSLWSRTLQGPNTSGVANAVAITTGGALVTGAAAMEMFGPSKLFVQKVGLNGDSIWSFTSEQEGEGTSIEVTPDGGSIVTGAVEIGQDQQTVLIKLTSAGTLQWQKVFTGPFEGQRDKGYAVIVQSDGYVVLEYRSETDSKVTSHIFKTDLSGNILWSKLIPGKHITNMIASNGGYLLAGTGGDAPKWNGRLVHLDALGNVIFDNNLMEFTFLSEAIATSQPNKYLMMGHDTNFAGGIMKIVQASVPPAVTNDVQNFNHEVYSVTASPNPAQDLVNFAFNAHAGSTEITLLNTAQQEVRKYRLDSIEGSNEVRINTAGLAAGAYSALIHTNGRTSHVRFQIVR